MVLSPNTLSSQQPGYYQTSPQTDQNDASLLDIGGYMGVFALLIPTRVIFDRAAASVGPSHLYRGFLASLTGGVHDLVDGYRQLWHEDGMAMFLKWPVLGFSIGVGAYTVQEIVQHAFNGLLKVTEEDISDRSLKWHASKALTLSFSGILLYPLTVAWTFYTTKKMPSLQVYIRDYVFRGKDFYFSALPLFSLNFVAFFINDIIRAKVLHFFKKTFFPDLITSSPQDDEYYDYSDDSRALVGGAYRPALFKFANSLLFLLSSMLGAFLASPIDTMILRLTSHPLRYGPLGIVEAFKVILQEEGVWGFYKGFLANLIFLMSSYYPGVDEEADTGKPPL